MPRTRLLGIAVAALAAVAIVPGRPAAAVPADLVDTVPPGPPGPPVVTEIGYTGATMSWAPATDDSGVITEYGIWRRTPDRGDMFYNATSAPSFRFGGLTPGTTYTFFVRASDGHNTGPASAPVTFQTLTAPAESQPPSQPGTPTVTAIEPTGATLSWTPATDNVAVTRYLIYRLAGTTRLLFAYAYEPNVRLNFLVPDREYMFVVVAEDPAGNRSEPSGPLRLRPPPDPAATCRLAFAGPNPVLPGEYRVAVTYTGATAVMHWSVRFTLPAGTTVTQSWSAGWEQAADQVTFWYDGWADVLTPGETITLDMVLAGPGSPDPASLRLNGAACAVA